MGSSHVEAWGSSHVEAWGSSHVVARGSSHVVAWGSSHVEAWGSVCVHNHSVNVSIELFGFAVAILVAVTKTVKRKSKTCSVVSPTAKHGTAAWLDRQGIEAAPSVTLFKRVSSEWKTQEGTTNETVWEVGSTLDHQRWQPKQSECGEGKFHACSRPFFCDEFRSNDGDRYVAIKIARTDLYAWPNAEYPHKIAFRRGTVLFECDRYGKQIERKSP